MNSITGTTPLGGLPAAERVILGRHALEVALIEIRFDSTEEAVNAADGLRIGEAIRSSGVDVPGQQPIDQQSLTVNVDPTGASHELASHARGWQYASADQSLVVVVLPALLSLQTTRYQRWSASLAPQLEAACLAIASTLKPQIINRVGLRYVNRFVDSEADTPAAWRGRINAALLGVIDHPQIGSRLTGAQQQFEINLGGASGALVRHGVFRDGATHGSFNYLLDLDVFDGQARAFDPSTVLEQATALNRTAMSLFREMVTDDYFNLQLDAHAVADEKQE